MKLPWVSRAEYDLVMAQRDSEHEAAREARVEYEYALNNERKWEKRFADLLARYHQLKLQGFTAPPAEPTATAPSPIDPIVMALNEASKGNPHLRAAGMRQAAFDKAAGLSVEEIISRIQRGNRPAEEVA